MPIPALVKSAIRHGRTTSSRFKRDQAMRIGNWIEGFEKPVQLATDSFLERIVEQTFQSHVPRLRRHHALDDTRVNRMAWLALASKNGGAAPIERFSI